MDIAIHLPGNVTRQLLHPVGMGTRLLDAVRDIERRYFGLGKPDNCVLIRRWIYRCLQNVVGGLRGWKYPYGWKGRSAFQDWDWRGSRCQDQLDALTQLRDKLLALSDGRDDGDIFPIPVFSCVEPIGADRVIRKTLNVNTYPGAGGSECGVLVGGVSRAVG
ncbi:hypothetical protein D3C84_645330 [compost metagenome]